MSFALSHGLGGYGASVAHGLNVVVDGASPPASTVEAIGRIVVTSLACVAFMAARAPVATVTAKACAVHSEDSQACANVTSLQATLRGTPP